MRAQVGRRAIHWATLPPASLTTRFVGIHRDLKEQTQHETIQSTRRPCSRNGTLAVVGEKVCRTSTNEIPRPERTRARVGCGKKTSQNDSRGMTEPFDPHPHLAPLFGRSIQSRKKIWEANHEASRISQHQRHGEPMASYGTYPATEADAGDRPARRGLTLGQADRIY